MLLWILSQGEFLLFLFIWGIWGLFWFLYFCFYFQTVFLLLVLGPFEMFQGCELPSTVILLVGSVSLFHFNNQRRAQVPGSWSFPAPGDSGFCSTTAEMLHPQQLFHLCPAEVLLLLGTVSSSFLSKDDTPSWYSTADQCHLANSLLCSWILDSLLPSGHAGFPLLLTGIILREGSGTFKGEHQFLLLEETLGVPA